MDCSECQHEIRNTTTEIYKRLKDARAGGMVHEQTMAVVLALVRKIEQQVTSKCDISN